MSQSSLGASQPRLYSSQPAHRTKNLERVVSCYVPVVSSLIRRQCLPFVSRLSPIISQCLPFCPSMSPMSPMSLFSCLQCLPLVSLLSPIISQCHPFCPSMSPISPMACLFFHDSNVSRVSPTCIFFEFYSRDSVFTKYPFCSSFVFTIYVEGLSEFEWIRTKGCDIGRKSIINGWDTGKQRIATK